MPVTDDVSPSFRLPVVSLGVGAMLDATEWYNANLRDPDLVRIISGFTKMQPELVAKLDLQRLPEVINLDSVATAVKLMKDNGMITGDIDLAAMTYPDALK